jgi:hypothetical protein
VRKLEGKRPLRKQGFRSGNNIKMNLDELRLGGVGWTDLAQERSLVNTLINLRVPQNAVKFFSSCTTGCLSRRVQLCGAI